MKIKSILYLALIFSFFGCEQIKEAATISISTKFSTDFPVLITAQNSSSTSSMVVSEASIIFSETREINLQNNFDVEPYLQKIKTINLSEVVVTVTGLTQGQTINTVTLSVAGIGNIITKTNIDMINNTFTPDIPNALLDQVAAKFKSERKISCTVSGTASGPMAFNVGLDIDARVIAYVLK
jgi:hypothetical protein